MILSILIASLKSREELLSRLLKRLHPQQTEGVEFIIDIDEGQIPVGQKRQRLLEQANGKYVSFVDDDDLVSEDYIPRVLTALQTSPDVVGMSGVITFDGLRPKRFIHSLRYTTWSEDSNAYYRNPNHLNPVRKELALKAGFPSINFGEDRSYSERLLPFLKSEAYIEDPIYFYLFSKKNSKTQKQ